VLDILVHIDNALDDTPTLRAAEALAGRERAFLTGLQIVPSTLAHLGLFGVSPSQSQQEAEAQARRAWWLDRCRRAGVEGDWEVIRGPYVSSLAKRSLLADLLFCALPVTAPDAPAGFDLLTRAMFAGAAPMLLVPDAWTGALMPERILVAWHGSAEAVRAIKAALPLLRRATEVLVLDGHRPDRAGFGPPSLELRHWLSRQGVAAQWSTLETADDVGMVLQARAQAMRAELLVMGAWGHSRMNELVLGGATRWLLDNAAQPLLLSH
jgi:nucleotide-binding universal stress UspA family protein